MAIDQVKTINELERLPQVEDSNAFAASTAGATGSVTANQIMEYLKQYLESLSNKSTTITQSNDQYPTCNAVSSEITRITNIMNMYNNYSVGYPKWDTAINTQTNNYTAPSRGWIFTGLDKEPSRDMTITINGTRVFKNYSDVTARTTCPPIPVQAGDIIISTPSNVNNYICYCYTKTSD